MGKLSEFKGRAVSEESGIGSLTLPGLLAETLERHASREALRWRDLEGVSRSWTYEELFAEARQVARSLLAAGAGKDSRIGLLCSNRPEWFFTLFGAAMAGSVTVALNTFSTRQELKQQLSISGVEILIIEAEVASRHFVDDIFELCPGLGDLPPGEYHCAELPYLRRVVCIDRGYDREGLQEWGDFLAAGDRVPVSVVEATAASVTPIDNGLIFFSSGSTALPKAILQPHRSAALQCWRFGDWFKIDASTRTWAANGFFFSGNFAQASGTLGVGGCLVLLRYFEPDKALALIQEEQVTHVIAWPHQEARLMECPGWDSADFSAVTTMNMDSAFRSHPTVTTDYPGMNGYGLTETFTFITVLKDQEMDVEDHGTVLPGNTLRIVDPETGLPLPIGETGEITVKGPTLMRGYLGVSPEETFDEQGFFHTRDAGYFTRDGHLHWKGRLSDIIKSGGANVSPEEVDGVLFTHPAIQKSCTLGIPDEKLGELVVSCVIPREGQQLTEEGVRNWARESLASYKVPRKVLFFTEEELPLTGSNKIIRSEMKKIVIARLEAATDID